MTQEALLEIAALADGSLPASRRAAVEARVVRAADLALALERQRRAVTAIRAAEPPAPPGLRARVEVQQGRGRPRLRWPRRHATD